ncbi:MAG: hypothetical protein AB1349_04090 [Elusimicrobiota bacterium]
MDFQYNEVKTSALYQDRRGNLATTFLRPHSYLRKPNKTIRKPMILKPTAKRVKRLVICLSTCSNLLSTFSNIFILLTTETLNRFPTEAFGNDIIP